ncbi:unnamed protein product [Cochlearia groenlandica]
MEFHGMKRKNLQALCKKHGIPANLTNIEMASRLDSVFKFSLGFMFMYKEIVTETNVSLEDSIEGDCVKAKKVSFSPEIEVFKFTRTVKKLKPKSVRSRKQASAQDLLQQGGIELRRSKRTVAKGLTTVAESKTGRETVEIEKDSNLLDDGAKTQNVRKPSQRIGSCGSTQEGCEETDLMVLAQFGDKETSKGLSEKVVRRSKRLAVSSGTSSNEVTLLPGKRSKRHVVTEDKEDDELVTNCSCKAAGGIEGSLVGKKTNETLFESSRRVTRRMKRDRSTDIETISTRGNITLKKLSDDNIVEARGSSKKSKTMRKECIEVSLSSSETEASASVVVTETVLDSTPEKSVDSSLKTNTQELNSELMEVECEEIFEGDTDLMAVTEEEKEEVSSNSASVQLTVSSPEAELLAFAGHIIHKDITSTMTMEENNKDETIVSSPRSELKEHESVAKSAKVEAILENSVECWKEIQSSQEDEKGSLEKEVQAANFHGNFSECNTENNNAEEETEIGKVGCMNVGLCVSLTPEKLFGELESEEAGGSSKKKKSVNQEFVKDKLQGMADVSPSTSETKATEPVMVSENVSDSTLKVSGDISLVKSTQESNSELLENKHEEDSVPIAGTKKDQEEASPSLSELVIECSEVETCQDNRSTGGYLSKESTPCLASVQSAMNNSEAKLGMPTGHTLDKDSVSTVITVEDIKTKEEFLISTPTPELKEHSSVSKLAKAEESLENSAKCCKDTPSSKDDEKGSFEKDLSAENLHGKFFEYDTEIARAEEKMETMDQECLKDKPQGITEGAPFTSDTEATRSFMIYENVLGSSVDISPRRNIHELNLELTEGEREEKHEQDTLLMATVKEKEEPSSLSASLNEGSKVSNAEADLDVPTSQILNKDVALTVVFEEDIETKEKSLVSTPRPEQEAHSFVAKLAETEAAPQNPSDLWEEIPSSKVDKSGPLDKDLQETSLHENFSEGNTESAEEQVNLQTLFNVKDDNVELSRFSATDFASPSPKEENISECFEKDEMKALCQPSLLNKADSISLDEFAVFTTPERDLLLMEQLSKIEKSCVAASANHHNDEAVDSCNAVITTLKQVSLTAQALIEEAGNKDEPSATCEKTGEISSHFKVTGSCSMVSGESSFHRSELEEHISVSSLAKAEAKCCKETRSSKDDEKGSLEKDSQAETIHGMLYEYDTDMASAEEEMKTMDQECLKDKPQGMAEGSPFTSETEATRSVMIYENVLGCSVDISPRRNIHELNMELMEGEREEKNEHDTLVMATVKEKEEPSSFSVSLNEVSKVSNPEAELSVPNSQNLVKDVALTVVSEEDIETKEETKEEHSSVAKLAETEEVQQNPSELWEEIHSSKDEAGGSLKATNLHEIFSECNTESAEEQVKALVKAKEDNVELSRLSQTDFAYPSYKEEHTSECFEKDEMKALPQPSLLNKADSISLDEFALFTTPERNVLLMEQLSEIEKTCVAESANHQNDEAVDSCNAVFTTLKRVSLTAQALIEEAGNEDEPTATCEKTDEISSHFEVTGSCSMVSGESSFHNAFEELVITVNNNADELVEAKVTNSTQSDYKESLLLNSSGETEDECLGGTCLKEKASDSIATAFEKAISLTPDEEAADKKMIKIEATPSPEQTLNESCENKEEDMIIDDESSKLSEKQVRREPVLIYRTQVKPKRHDMKENAHNSKNVDSLNLTAPRTSKRQPLQDLK